MISAIMEPISDEAPSKLSEKIGVNAGAKVKEKCVQEALKHEPRAYPVLIRISSDITWSTRNLKQSNCRSFLSLLSVMCLKVHCVSQIKYCCVNLVGFKEY
jgi:hypothetical protein